MEKKAGLSVLIPAYNEAECVSRLSHRLLPVLDALANNYEVDLILIDDGSLDGTAGYFRAAFSGYDRLQVVRHDVNKGLGAAIKSGFDAARGDIVCMLDSDCSYAPEELPGMIQALVESGAGIVTASPYHPDGVVEGVPGWRLVLSKGLSRIYALLLPVRLHTYTSMFRVYRKRWATRALVQSDGFVAVTEIIANAAFLSADIREYPAKLHRRMLGRSKLRPLPVIWAHLRFMVHYIMEH